MVGEVGLGLVDCNDRFLLSLEVGEESIISDPSM
jgi:hypothetical protein